VLSIRKCKKKDILSVIKIENESFEYPYRENIFYYFLNSNKFLVAEVEGKVVGYIISSIRGDEGLIISIAVLPSHRRKGIGKALMEKSIELLETDVVMLTLREHNRAALNFYNKLGFKIKGIIKEYYENDDDAIVMKKRID